MASPTSPTPPLKIALAIYALGACLLLSNLINSLPELTTQTIGVRIRINTQQAPLSEIKPTPSTTPQPTSQTPALDAPSVEAPPAEPPASQKPQTPQPHKPKPQPPLKPNKPQPPQVQPTFTIERPDTTPPPLTHSDVSTSTSDTPTPLFGSGLNTLTPAPEEPETSEVDELEDLYDFLNSLTAQELTHLVNQLNNHQTPGPAPQIPSPPSPPSVFADTAGADVLVMVLTLNDQYKVVDVDILVPSRYPMEDLALALSSKGSTFKQVFPPIATGEVRRVQVRYPYLHKKPNPQSALP